MTSITTNIAAQRAQGNLKTTFGRINDSAQRLSSGNRIVRASDDAAGLAIGTGLRSDVATLKTAISNIAQAIALLNTADGALAQIGEILQRMKELAVQANSGTLGSTERGFLDIEFQGLTSQIDAIATQTNFNGVVLLDGTAAGTSNATTNVSTAATLTYTVGGTTGTAALNSTSGINIEATTRDLSLQGSLSDADVSINYVSNANYDFEFIINGVVYNAYNVNINSGVGADFTVTLTNSATSGTIELLLDSTTVATLNSPGNQTVANTVATNIEADLDATVIYQNRNFVNGTSGAVVYTNNAIGTIVEGLSGTSFTLKSNNFDGSLAPTIGAFDITAETASTDGKISVLIGSSIFSTAAGAFNTNAGDLKTLGAITLTSADDSNETLIINFANLDSDNTGIDTADGAQGYEDGLNTLFNVGSVGALDFQVGLAATDLISVTIADVQSAALFIDADGNAQDLDLTTVANANIASAVADLAINSVLSARASVGANQSRFGFTAANLESAVTNLDAARGGLLDTNVTTESTAFATNQVLQQAGISVLAQANLLPQNLLKLLG